MKMQLIATDRVLYDWVATDHSPTAEHSFFALNQSKTLSSLKCANQHLLLKYKVILLWFFFIGPLSSSILIPSHIHFFIFKDSGYYNHFFLHYVAV